MLLVEAVWRLLRWQPAWHARVKYLERLKHGSSLKKKIAVALARQLAIDLWRWRTGRASAADLGLETSHYQPTAELDTLDCHNS